MGYFIFMEEQEEKAKKPLPDKLSCRVLLAEDNEINAMITVEILGQKGVTVDVAENGKAAVDKFAACGLHAAPGSVLTDCPVLEESPVNLECRITQRIPLGSHDLFLAEVVACDVDESLLDEKGKLCLDKANLIVYSHGEYLALGKKLGTFGYSVRKKKPAKRKK